jgi:DNA-binding NtrC family response regulator
MAAGTEIERDDLLLGGRVIAQADRADDLFALPIKEAREEFERQYFQRLLADTGGNLSEAARRADYSRQGLRDLLKRLGIYSEG